MAADCLEHVEVIARLTGSRLTSGATDDIDTPYFCVLNVPPQPWIAYHPQSTPELHRIGPQLTRRLSTSVGRAPYDHVCGSLTVLV